MKTEYKKIRPKKGLIKISKMVLLIVLGLGVQFLPISAAKNWGNVLADNECGAFSAGANLTCAGTYPLINYITGITDGFTLNLASLDIITQLCVIIMPG